MERGNISGGRISGRSTRTPRKRRKINDFWKKLTTDHLSMLHLYFQNGGVKQTDGRSSSRAGSDNRVQNQDSVDGTNSLISSTGLARGDTLSEDCKPEEVLGGGAETSRKGSMNRFMKRCRNKSRNGFLNIFRTRSMNRPMNRSMNRSMN